MKKRKIMLLTTMMLAVLLIAGGTFAWFTASTGTATNKFQAGTLNICLYDSFEWCAAQNVNPGDCFYKEVFVINTGTKRSFVRVEKDMAFENADLSVDGVVEYALGSNWVEEGDYFYYTKELKAPYKRGHKWVYDRTTDLFAKNNKGKHICFDGENMNNDYQGQKFNIKIKANAIQVTNGAALEEWGINPKTLSSSGVNALNSEVVLEFETDEQIEVDLIYTEIEPEKEL